MPASLGVLLVCGCRGALLRLLSGLLPYGGLSGGALLGLLGSDGLLSCGGFGSGPLLRLLPCGGFGSGSLLRLLPCGGLGSGSLLRLLACGGFGSGLLLRLLPCGSFSGCTLLRRMIRCHCWSSSRVRAWWRVGSRRRWCQSRLRWLMNSWRSLRWRR